MTEQDQNNDQVTPQRRGPRGPGAPRRLVERDLDMLASLSTGRYLTVQALEWLHFPGWASRYQTYVEAREAKPDLVFRPAPHVYHRLGALREAVPPMVYRLTRSREQGRLRYQPLPDVYALTPAGAELLSARRGIELDTLWSEDLRHRSIKNLEHTVAIGTFYAALRCSMEYAGLALTDWQGDHLLSRRDPERGGPSYDRVLVPGIKEAMPILPDATFSLAGQRYFVEIDRGTTNRRSWQEKIRAFEHYRSHRLLQARYGVEDFTVLVVCVDENRQNWITQEVLKITRQATDRYRFLLAERVHPTVVRPGWRAVRDFAWQRRKVVDRMVEMPGEIQWGAAPLWKSMPTNSTAYPAE